MSDEKKNPKREPGNPSIPYGPSQLPWGKQVPKGATITAPIEDPIKVPTLC